MSSRVAIWIALLASLPLAVTASAQTAAAQAPATTSALPEAPAPTPTPTVEATAPTPTVEAPAPPPTVEAPATAVAPATTVAPAATLGAATQAPAPTNGAPAPTPPGATEAVLLPSTKGRQGFDILAMAAFGKSTDQAYGLDVEPYGASFGLDSGYTWGFGLRLGASVNYGLGRSLAQERDPRVGRTTELTTDATSLNAALSVGHDLWLRFLILRYSWNFGVTWMNYDFVSVPPGTIRGYPSSKGSVVGFHAAPGLAVLWPLGRFTFGLGFDYVIQTKNQIPSGILPKLLVGVKL